MTRDQIYIIGGGTFSFIRGHAALAAVAFGTTAFDLYNIITYDSEFTGELHLYTTRMAGDTFTAVKLSRVGGPFGDGPTIDPVVFGEEDPKADECYQPKLITNDDVLRLALEIVNNPRAKILFLPAALCDFNASVMEEKPIMEPLSIDDRVPMAHVRTPSGRYAPRLDSSKTYLVELEPAVKVIRHIREKRKDLFLVGFKETHKATEDAMFEAGLRLVKQASCNLVLVNDLVTSVNMIVTPEQARYEVTRDRSVALCKLVEMALSRSNGHFTRSHVMGDDGIAWASDKIPDNLRIVVEHLISRGAFRPFPGKKGKPATVGHFAFKVNDRSFITSPRGKDFNQLVDPHSGVQMVYCKTLEGEKMALTNHDEGLLCSDKDILAYGGSPSVGGMSQRIIFKEHPKVDCIVHFHSPLREGFTSENFKTRQQWPYECGSHECGKNTSDGLDLWMVDKDGNELKAVMLEKHGPNIAFSKDFDPQKVIEFIERYWDPTRQTSELT